MVGNSLYGSTFRFSYPHIEPKHGTVNVNPLVCISRFRQIQIRYVHEIYSTRNGVPRIEVVTYAASQHESKRQVLPLRIGHAQGPLASIRPTPRRKSKKGATRQFGRTKLAPVAIKAMAAKLARLVYRMLRYGMKYVDQGAAFYEVRQRELQIKRLKAKAEKLGYRVTPIAAAA